MRFIRHKKYPTETTEYEPVDSQSINSTLRRLQHQVKLRLSIQKRGGHEASVPPKRFNSLIQKHLSQSFSVDTE